VVAELHEPSGIILRLGPCGMKNNPCYSLENLNSTGLLGDVAKKFEGRIEHQ
jgi:hypothetical protein